MIWAVTAIQGTLILWALWSHDRAHRMTILELWFTTCKHHSSLLSLKYYWPMFLNTSLSNSTKPPWICIHHGILSLKYLLTGYTNICSNGMPSAQMDNKRNSLYALVFRLNLCWQNVSPGWVGIQQYLPIWNRKRHSSSVLILFNFRLTCGLIPISCLYFASQFSLWWWGKIGKISFCTKSPAYMNENCSVNINCICSS